MSFDLTEEQQEFKSTIERFFKDTISSDYLRTRMGSAFSTDAEFWKQVEELGFNQYFTEQGTDGGNFTDLGLIAVNAGKVLMPEPIVDRLFAGPLLSKLVGGDFQKQICESDRVCIAIVSNQIDQKSTELSISCDFVVGLTNASVLVLLDDVSKTIGVVKLSELSEKQLNSLPLNALDSLCDIHKLTVTGAPVQLIAADSAMFVLMYRTLKAIELVGVSEQVVEMTREYVLTRKQFGKQIGSFQAVKHKLVDMYLHMEAMRSVVFFAAWAADHDLQQFPLAAYTAIDFACDKAVSIVESAIQLHGGIGFTWEFDLHLFLRRAKTYSVLYKLDTEAKQLLVELAHGS